MCEGNIQLSSTLHSVAKCPAECCNLPHDALVSIVLQIPPKNRPIQCACYALQKVKCLTYLSLLNVVNTWLSQASLGTSSGDSLKPERTVPGILSHRDLKQEIALNG